MEVVLLTILSTKTAIEVRLDLASAHPGDPVRDPGPPFPHLSALDRLNQADKKEPRPLAWQLPRHPAQVFGEAPSPCQACVLG